MRVCLSDRSQKQSLRQCAHLAKWVLFCCLSHYIQKAFLKMAEKCSNRWNTKKFKSSQFSFAVKTFVYQIGGKMQNIFTCGHRLCAHCICHGTVYHTLLCVIMKQPPFKHLGELDENWDRRKKKKRKKNTSYYPVILIPSINTHVELPMSSILHLKNCGRAKRRCHPPFLFPCRDVGLLSV